MVESIRAPVAPAAPRPVEQRPTRVPIPHRSEPRLSARAVLQRLTHFSLDEPVSKPKAQEAKPVRPEGQHKTPNFSPLPDRLTNLRETPLLKQTTTPTETVTKVDKSKLKPHELKASRSARGILSKLAGFVPDIQPQVAKVDQRAAFPPNPIQSRSLRSEQPNRRHVATRETHRQSERVSLIKHISVKNAEALIMQATEAKPREPIPKDEFKTLHPSEHFFKNIPKLKEIPKTNQETAGSVPDSRIVAEKNMATPYEVYKRQDMKGQTIFVIRKLHSEALPMKLIKDDGEAQNIKADNGRDVVHTLAFQTKESGKNKYFRLEESADLTMRFVEITDKKQIAKVIAKRQEYARKMGILPKRDSLRDHPGLEIRASQKKRDHFYTWHDMLNKISMRSIQTLGKAHIVCDRSLPPEKASAFSKKFIEAYYSDKYEGLSIEERTKQAYMDTLKELGLEKEPSVATYLVTHEDTAYTGGTGTRARVTASYTDTLEETEPPEVFQLEQTVFKSTVFTIGGRELVLEDDTPPPVKGNTPEVSPDNGIKLILQPDE